MGTRADFYVGRGALAEWLGSIAWSGHPEGVDKDVLAAENETGYRNHLAASLAEREDATVPEQGWPWPWRDSETTDYAYAFEDGRIYYSHFGGGWRLALSGELDDIGTVEFPDMTERQNVDYGKRSGLMFFSGSDAPEVSDA